MIIDSATSFKFCCRISPWLPYKVSDIYPFADRIVGTNKNMKESSLLGRRTLNSTLKIIQEHRKIIRKKNKFLFVIFCNTYIYIHL